jgi:hypothetical protein
MKDLAIITLIVFFGTLCLKAQTSRFIIDDEIKLPKDSMESVLLISNLTNFLNEAGSDVKSTEWVLAAEKLTSGFILSELKRISQKKFDAELSLHVNNIMPIGNNKYLIQFSYTNESTLIAFFEIMATRENDVFKFSSTLAWNTKNWETLTDDYFTVYFDNGNKNLCEQYIRHSKRFDEMLGNPKQKEIVFYSGNSDDLSSLLRLTGILYHIDYNGLTWSMTDNHSSEGIVKLFTSRMSNIETLDPHDLFHGRSSMGIPYSKQNRLMVCGGAYVYAGSWGFSWLEIQKKFKSNFDYSQHTDWLKAYFDKTDFGDEAEKGLFTTQFINALIVQDLEKNKGFSAVKVLLASGNMHQNREGFFTTLEELTGINESNFNEKVGKLIDDAMRKI